MSEKYPGYREDNTRQDEHHRSTGQMTNREFFTSSGKGGFYEGMEHNGEEWVPDAKSRARQAEIDKDKCPECECLSCVCWQYLLNLNVERMKIYTYNIYKNMKNTTSFWWLMTPKVERFWSGQLIYIGVRAFGVQLDFRGINNIQDFADALSYHKIWHILKRFKKK